MKLGCLLVVGCCVYCNEIVVLIKNRELLISTKCLCQTGLFEQGVSKSVFVSLELAAEENNDS